MKPMVCNSGGALGADTVWEETCGKYGVVIRAWSHKTPYHTSLNKIEVSDEDYNEGVERVKKALVSLRRSGGSKYMNLLARNWAQVKYSDAVYAVGTIIRPGQKDDKGYVNKSTCDVVSGGTGYAVLMAIDVTLPVFVFDQNMDGWYRWSYVTRSFVPWKEEPRISHTNFAGIGTRKLSEKGKGAIIDILSRTFDDE
jgi:hypothetical protein